MSVYLWPCISFSLALDLAPFVCLSSSRSVFLLRPAFFLPFFCLLWGQCLWLSLDLSFCLSLCLFLHRYFCEALPLSSVCFFNSFVLLLPFSVKVSCPLSLAFLLASPSVSSLSQFVIYLLPLSPLSDSLRFPFSLWVSLINFVCVSWQSLPLANSMPFSIGVSVSVCLSLSVACFFSPCFLYVCFYDPSFFHFFSVSPSIAIYVPLLSSASIFLCFSISWCLSLFLSSSRTSFLFSRIVYFHLSQTENRARQMVSPSFSPFFVCLWCVSVQLFISHSS